MECKDTQILSWDKDCYGEKKEKIIAEFFLTPLAYFKLIPGQKSLDVVESLR